MLNSRPATAGLAYLSDEHAVEFWHLLEGFLEPEGPTPHASATLPRFVPRGEHELALLFAKALHVIDDPSHYAVAKDRVQRVLQYYVRPEFGSNPPAVLRQLERDIARLLTLFDQPGVLRNTLSRRASEFALWTEATLDFALARVIDADSLLDAELFSGMLQACGPAARQRLIEAARAHVRFPKVRLSFLFEAHALSEADYAELFDLAAAEWTTVLDDRASSTDDGPTWDDHLFETVLDAIQDELTNGSPAMTSRLNAAHARAASAITEAFFSSLYDLRFTWLDRDDWPKILRAAQLRPCVNRRPSLRLVDPAECGHALVEGLPPRR